MIYRKPKKTFAAVFLSGALLLQNASVLAAPPGTMEWLNQTPFSPANTPVVSSSGNTSETDTSADIKPDSDTEMQTETDIRTELYQITDITEETDISENIEPESDNTTESEISVENLIEYEIEKDGGYRSSPLEIKVQSADFRKMLKAVSLSPDYDVVMTEFALSWEQLESELSYRINSYPSKWSLYLKDLTTGNIISINERAQESASLIKLYVMGAVMQDIKDGSLEMNDTIKKLLNEMITVSDNSATNELVRYLDPDHDHRSGLEKLNTFIEEQGFENTYAYNGLEDSSLWYSINTPNTTSTQDCGNLLEQIYRGTFISHLSSHQMEDLLLNQQVTYKIPSTIPDESTVANKTGETSDCENDAAIVFTPKGDYILCIMSCEVSSKSSAVTCLREMSSLIYNYFMNRKELP